MIIWGRREGFLGNDPFTKLLLHMNGADTSTSFVDSSRSGHVITAAGNAQVDTAQSVFGGASCLLDGTGDWLQTPIDSDFDFGTGNFTVDLRVRFASVAADRTFFCFQESGDDYIRFDWVQATEKLEFIATNGASSVADYSGDWSPSADTWYHLAVVRNGTALAIYVNGTALSLTESTAISTNDIGVDDGGAVDSARIGAFYDTNLMNGWIDEFRVSKGIARWTANFTPPTIAYR